jgi:hypothetical protein
MRMADPLGAVFGFPGEFIRTRLFARLAWPFDRAVPGAAVFWNMELSLNETDAIRGDQALNREIGMTDAKASLVPIRSNALKRAPRRFLTCLS